MVNRRNIEPSYRPNLIRLAAIAVAVACASSPTLAQSLDERLDEERFLRGLGELQLPDVLEAYVEAHPAAGPVDAARYEIVALQITAANPQASPTERREAIEQIITLRGQLIEKHDDDPRYARWLTDQAWDLVFELPALDGVLLSAIYGVPSPVQHQLARRISREGNELTDEAELAIEQAIIDFEAQPGYTDDPALQAARRRLDRDERRRRIPLLRGVTAYLHARFNVSDAAERGELCRIALDRLSPLADELDGFIGMQATLFAALAAMELRQTDEARAWFERAADAPTAAPVDAFGARMGLNMVLAAEGNDRDALQQLSELEKQYNSPRDLVFRLLITDRRFLLRVQQARRGSSANRMRDMADAYRTYTNLLRKDLGVSKETVRQIVYARLATAGGADTPLDQLPAIVTIARAEGLRGAGGDADQIISMLEGVLDRRDAENEDRAEALYGLGVTHYANGDARLAGDRFTALCRQYSTHPRAERSIKLAVTIAAEQARDHPRDESARDALAATLTLAVERYPTLPEIEQWRYLSGRIALADGNLELAQSRFEAIPPDADEWLDAQLMLGGVMRDRVWSATESQARSDQLRALTGKMGDMITRIDQHVRVGDAATDANKAANHQARLAIIAAEAWIELSNPDEAVRMIELIRSDDALNAATTAEVLRTRILAYQAARRPDEASRALTQFLETSPDLAAVTEMIEQPLRELRAARRGSQQAAAVQAQLVQLTEPIDRWLTKSGGAGGDPYRLRLALAESRRECEQHQSALRLYDLILAERADSLEALFGRAECLFGLTASSPNDEQLADAMRAYKRISAARTSAGDAYYWRSELRMLEILDRLGRNTHRIGPRIQRLRQRDASLGGYRRQFEQLAERHS